MTDRYLFQITLPMTTNDGATYQLMHTQFEKAACEIAGGFTAHDAKGGWQREDGSVQIEIVRVYTIYTTQSIMATLTAAAIELFSDQWEIMVSVIGKATFVKGKASQSSRKEG